MHGLGLDNPADVLGAVLEDKSTIVGVVKDFHVKSLHSPVIPNVIGYKEHNFISVKLDMSKEAGLSSILSKIETSYKNTYPDAKIKYKFLDNEIASQYASEIKNLKLIGLSAAVSLILSIIGIFSLSSFTTIQRRKEVSIRKAMGSTSLGITLLLLKDFVSLFIISLVVAIPLGYYIVGLWLSNFAYKIGSYHFIFIFSAVLCLLIGILSVSFNAIRLSKTNPIEFLRSE